jgi:hypothetical protein
MAMELKLLLKDVQEFLLKKRTSGCGFPPCQGFCTDSVITGNVNNVDKKNLSMLKVMKIPPYYNLVLTLPATPQYLGPVIIIT